MDAFERREKGFEAKFQMDEEMRFRADSRRDRLLGLWAAQQMGLKGETAARYATSVVEADLALPGDADVIAKVLGDLKTFGLAIDEAALRRKMVDFTAQAREQIREEFPESLEEAFESRPPEKG